MSASISNPGVIDRDEMIDVNLTPVFLVTQAVLRKGAKKEGTHHPMQRLTLIYLATYLIIGGCGFLVAPALALRLLLSNGAYGDIMRDEFRQVLARLESGVVRVSLPGRTGTVPMHRGRVVEWFRAMLYRPETARSCHG